MRIRIGHLSDIHVPAGVQPTLRDLLGKRLTGYLNFKLRRQQEYDVRVLEEAVRRLIEEKVDAVIVSGDLTNLAYAAEFQRAYTLLQPLSDAGIPYFVIPGNHDRYLARAIDGTMERLFAGHLGTPLSDDDAYPWIDTQCGATLIGLNSAVPNAPFQAWGQVSEAQIDAVARAKDRIAHHDQPVVLAVHHHLGKAPHKKRDHHRNLRNSDDVLQLAKDLNATLVLHGHNHFLDIRDMDGVRVFASSSSISNQQGEHRRAGQVAIHTLTPGAAPTHHVAYWLGDAFSPWKQVSPAHLPPDRDALPALPAR